MSNWPIPLILLACVGCSTTTEKEKKAVDPRTDSLDFLVLAGDEPVRLELRIEIDGRPTPKVWDEAFAKLFAFYDRNGNGSLDKIEAARLPTPLALRQVVWGQFSQPISSPAWADLDANKDDKVDAAELADFYRRSGLGSALVGIGKPNATDKLTDSLLKFLDVNKDGVVDADEWKAASETLRKLDKNEDELIGPGELVSGLAYPGTMGTRLLTTPALEETPDASTDSFPLMVLPNRITNVEWAAAAARRETPKLLQTVTPESLLRLRGTMPFASWTVKFGERASVEVRGEKPPANERVVLSRDLLRIELRASAGKLDEQTTTARKHLLSLFKEADLDADGSLNEKELGITKAGPFKLFLPSADRDADGKLTAGELDDWLDLQDQIAKAHTLVTVLDHGCGLFEFIDADHDGALSVRELRTASDRLKAAGCVTDKGIDRAKLPHQLLAVVSRGHPQAAIGKPVRPGPAWFVAMDRNGDGDVSRREFTGPGEVFAKLDQDKDGLLSPDEADKAEKSKK